MARQKQIRFEETMARLVVEWGLAKGVAFYIAPIDSQIDCIWILG